MQAENYKAESDEALNHMRTLKRNMEEETARLQAVKCRLHREAEQIKLV